MTATPSRLAAIARRLRRPERGSPSPAQAFPPGAFYSPLPDERALLAEPERSRVWPQHPQDPAGIDVRAREQLAFLDRLSRHRMHPRADGAPAYDPANDQFPPQDAALLHAVISELRPRRVVEVGCGWSTTVTAAAIAAGGLGTELTCIEPYPRDLLRHIPEVHELREEKVEHTPAAVFERLAAGDVLFVDSSHVAKTGSDVVYLVLDVLPRLGDGVVVHFHDVFLPEDYPQQWVRAGFGWNEQYLLQAYLAENRRAHVLAMNRWLARRHPDAVRRAFGDVGLDGSSVWFRLQGAGATAG